MAKKPLGLFTRKQRRLIKTMADGINREEGRTVDWSKKKSWLPELVVGVFTMCEQLLVKKQAVIALGESLTLVLEPTNDEDAFEYINVHNKAGKLRVEDQQPIDVTLHPMPANEMLILMLLYSSGSIEALDLPSSLVAQHIGHLRALDLIMSSEEMATARTRVDAVYALTSDGEAYCEVILGKRPVTPSQSTIDLTTTDSAKTLTLEA